MNYFSYDKLERNVKSLFCSSHRKLLFVNNLFLFMFALSLIALSGYLSWLFYVTSDADSNAASAQQKKDTSQTMWLNWLGLAGLGMALSAICILGMRGAHVVTLDLLLSYFWCIVVCLAPLLLFCVACFDFYQYVTIWFEHSWDSLSFEKLRGMFCAPGTANNSCMIEGNEDRSEALNQAVDWGRFFTLIEAASCIVSACSIILSIFLCQRLLTTPVITQSMNDMMNYLLLLPAMACAYMAYDLWWMERYQIPIYGMAEIFLILAVFQFVIFPLGIVAGRLKSQKLMAVYLFVASLITCALGGAGGVCVFLAGLLPEEWGPTSEETADIACYQDFSGCCCCDAETDRCPEWDAGEVVLIVTLDIKIAAMVAFVSTSYLIGALAVSGLVQDNLRNYRQDYV